MAILYYLKVVMMAIALIAVLISGSIPLPSVFAQDFGGGVDKEGSWYVGEGLKQGDYFYYELCHVDYKECTEFGMEIWIEGDVQVGSESKWLAQTVVYDGSKILKGTMELGKVAPEPTGGSDNLVSHRAAFKSSVIWLSAFATSYGGEGGEGPKEFSIPSWGKIGNIGGEQVKPTALETTSTSAGTFDTVLVTWKTGGAVSQIWVVDEFPFPIKASTWTHVSEGIPPQEYRFELLDYKENVQSNPFTDVVDTEVKKKDSGCLQNYDFVKVRKPTKNFDYLIDLKYGPENPQTGCDIEWIISFHNKFDETEFLNQVQYDILVVDDTLAPLRSIAQEDNRNFLFSGSGQVRTFMPVNEDPGLTNYVIWIYGLAPEFVVPSATPDWLEIPITISGDTLSSTIPIAEPVTSEVPSWIKTTAGFWVGGATSDNEFISAIEYLINNDVIVIPPTSSGPGSTGATEIPSWIKTTTGFWTDGFTSDDEFVGAIQYLIENGIMQIG